MLEVKKLDYKAIEKKWQKKWEETNLYKFDETRADDKYYVLEMFSYPSAAKLHIGHWYNYGPTDTFARFMRMQGRNVFHPMGFDSFGLPAENYAIKTGVHPKDSTYENIGTMEQQLKAIGATFDWDYEVVTSDADYYKWTQWCFLQLYKHGLAYRKEAPVNWCPSCNTVLANEQVIDGECERCSSLVVRKNLTQWFFKITDYAEELLQGLDKLEWPERTKTMQKNWIGKSVGSEVTFQLCERDDSFTVFTTRADTLFGCTYCVLAPEHPLVKEITTPEQQAEVQRYIEQAARQSDIERLSTTNEKTGAFTGAYCINPVNGRKVPIWVADYVLFSYGTGAVMAVPAHDTRDFEFATKFNLPIERVIKGKEGVDDALPFVEYGILVNSPNYDGLTTEQGKEAITKGLEEKQAGAFKVNYRLRDWLISRQRYWGAPIPIIHCPKCGIVPVPEEQLPVELPYDVDFTPDGTSPLKKNADFYNVKCPVCGEDAHREADTMDTFVCSSWYFLRYPDNKNEKQAWNKEWIDKLLPVDTYVGGAEHACMHLLYARFFTKALRDMGYLSFDEPFLRLVHQGTILGPDGNKMSKSHGNVVSPDEYVSQYGADIFRMYLMFGFSYIEGGAWNDDGIKAMKRFFERIEKLVDGVKGQSGENAKVDADLNFILHNTILRVTEDLARFQFNTAIARLMELVNGLYKYIGNETYDKAFTRQAVEKLILLLSPFAPHFAEENWQVLGMDYSIFNVSWPKHDEKALVKDVVSLGVQVNGKVRGRIDAAQDATEDEIRQAVLADERIKEYIDGKEIVKFIVIKGRLVNIVVK
ncbi:leucine--tRNA ligase [Clostridia bacterium OttesenSCG-928-F22]|nr:leucine--tRNA ligase [Clostridia bacterium OttesenSCG-928-F22]